MNETLYEYSGQPCWLHYVGGYVSLSTAQQDILQSAPHRLAPFHRTRTNRVQVGEHKTVMQEMGTEKYTTADGRTATREIVVAEHESIEPVYENVTTDVTPAAKPMGSPIKVGDDVALIGRGNPIKGALTELTDDYAKIDDVYYFWQGQTISVVRQKDLPKRRR